MAYPYPSAEGAGSSSSLVGAGHGHGHGQGHHGHGHAHGHSVSARSDVSRKASEGDNDVLQAFKVCPTFSRVAGGRWLVELR